MYSINSCMLLVFVYGFLLYMFSFKYIVCGLLLAVCTLSLPGFVGFGDHFMT